MRCTNFSSEPFKSLVEQMNTAAADHIASVIEASNFRNWYGSEALPVIKDLKITNDKGEVWDLRKTLNTWKKQAEIAAGFRDKEGEPVLHELDADQVFSGLSGNARYYNEQARPFRARVVRKTVTSDNGNTRQYYITQLEFNKDYKKPEQPNIAEHTIPSIKDAAVTETKALPDFMGAAKTGTNNKAPGAKFLTGYADLDKYIEALLATKNSLFRQRAAVKNDLTKIQSIDSHIEAIDRSVTNLKADAELSTLMVVGKTILNQLQNDLPAVATFNEIDNGLRLAKAWKELDQVIDFAPEDPDEETKTVLKDAVELRSAASTLFTSYLKKYKDKLLNTVDEYLKPRIKDGEEVAPSQTIVNEQGDFVFMDVGKSGALFIGKSFSTNAMEQLLDHLLRESDHRSSQENYQFETRMEEAVHDLLAKSAHHTGASDFDFLFTGNKDGSKSLVTKYDRNFYKDFHIKQYLAFEKGKKKSNKSEHYQAALALGATEAELKGDLTIKDYYKWEAAHFKYELTEEGQKEYERFIEEQRKMHITHYDEANNPVYDEKTIKAIEQEWNPEQFQKYLDGDSKVYNKGKRWYTREMKSVPVSKEYAKLSAKQLKFYNFFVGEFLDGQQDLVRDYRFGDVDFDSQLLDFVVGLRGDLKDKVQYLGKGLQDFLHGIYAIKGNGDPVVHNPTRALTGKEHLGAEFKGIERFLPDNNQMREVHPLKVLEEFRKAGFLFKHKREIEDTVNAINDLAQTADKIETLPDGRIKSDIVGRMFTTKSKTNVADRIEYNAKVGLTGVRTEPLSRQQGKPGEWKASAAQVVESVNNYTRFKNMALSPLSAVGNLVAGTMNNMIYAASGEHFSDKELTHAYWIMKENVLKGLTMGQAITPTARKIAELFKRYSLMGDVTEEMYHENDVMGRFFMWMKSGEFMNQGSTIIAQMLRKKVTTKDGKEVRLWDMYDIDPKTKKLVFLSNKLSEDSEWNNDRAQFDFFEKVKKVNLKIHGDYTNALMAKKDQWGRILLMFRTWLPMAVKERFGAEYTDEVLGQQKGRYRSVGSLVSNAFNQMRSGDYQGSMDLLKFIGKVILPVVGRKLKFSSNLSEVDRNNLAMMVRETQFILMTAVACMMIRAHVDDPDDDAKTQSMMRYLYNQGERAQTELEFFFSPSQTIQYVQDIAPISSTLIDGWKVIARVRNYALGQDDTYQRGVNKGRSKIVKATEDFTPVLRSIDKAYGSTQQLMNNSQYQ